MIIDIEEKNARSKANGDRELPDWAGIVAKFFYLGLGVCLLISSLALGGCSASASDALHWQDATEVISEEQARQIVAENSSAPDEEISSITASMRVAQLQDGILIVDFNTPYLTGSAGNLYTIYDAEGDRIFNRYLSKQLPENVPVIQPTERTNYDYPCIWINTLNQPSNSEILRLTLCFDGAHWSNVNQEVLDASSFS